MHLTDFVNLPDEIPRNLPDTTVRISFTRMCENMPALVIVIETEICRVEIFIAGVLDPILIFAGIALFNRPCTLHGELVLVSARPCEDTPDTISEMNSCCVELLLVLPGRLDGVPVVAHRLNDPVTLWRGLMSLSTRPKEDLPAIRSELESCAVEIFVVLHILDHDAARWDRTIHTTAWGAIAIL